MLILEPDQSAEVLNLFPDRDQANILLRIATLDGIQPTALSELNEILEKQFSGNQGGQTTSVGGLKTAADILNFVEGSVEAAIMEKLRKQNQILVKTLKILCLYLKILLMLMTVASKH